MAIGGRGPQPIDISEGWQTKDCCSALSRQNTPLPAITFALVALMPAETNRVIKEEKFRVGDPHLTNVQGKRAGEAILKLLPKIENYTSAIPDAVLMDLMTSAGFSANDPIVVRLMSLAAHKFLSSLTYDALQHCKVRTSNSSSKSHHGHSHVTSSSHGGSGHRQDRRMLTMEDLTPALAEHGITIKKPPYYE